MRQRFPHNLILILGRIEVLDKPDEEIQFLLAIGDVAPQLDLSRGLDGNFNYFFNDYRLYDLHRLYDYLAFLFDNDGFDHGDGCRYRTLRRN